MARLQFCDYHNMFAFLEKGEFNSDFHPMVDFIAASPLRYALTVKPTIFVSHIRQFWSTARIETTDEGTHILTTVDANEPASPVRDVSEGEACPTDSGFIADQDRAAIAKSSTLPHDSAPRERVKVLEDKEDVAVTQSGDDAPIKGRSINEGEAAAKRIKGIDVPTGSGFIPIAGPPATVIFTCSEVGPTASSIATRRKGKEVMVESDTLKKKRLQDQIDAQGMIDSLDKSNETIAKYLQEYQDFASELPLEKRIELISDLVKYQDNYSKVKDFIPMGSKDETKRLKRKGLNLEQEQVKKQKSSEEAPEIETSTEDVTEEKIKEMMQLVPVEDVYV
nr:hypothetical protein [Tanacetum cinerariifolium]